MCLQYRLELGSFLAVNSGNLLHRILKSRLLKLSLAWKEESGRSSKWTVEGFGRDRRWEGKWKGGWNARKGGGGRVEGMEKSVSNVRRVNRCGNVIGQKGARVSHRISLHPSLPTSLPPCPCLRLPFHPCLTVSLASLSMCIIVSCLPFHPPCPKKCMPKQP